MTAKDVIEVQPDKMVFWQGKFHKWSIAFDGDNDDICAAVRYDGTIDSEIQKQLLDARVSATEALVRAEYEEIDGTCSDAECSYGWDDEDDDEEEQE